MALYLWRSGLFSGSLVMLVVPSHMLPPNTNSTGRTQAGRAQDVLLERFICPFMCPFGPRASQASGRAERRRSEDERAVRVKPFAEMQGRMTLSLNYSGLSKHRMKCWMWQCSPCQHSVWEAARQREVQRVCSAAGTAAGPCQLTSDLLRAYQWPASALAVTLGTLLSLLFLVLLPWHEVQQQTYTLQKQRAQDQHKAF